MAHTRQSRPDSGGLGRLGLAQPLDLALHLFCGWRFTAWDAMPSSTPAFSLSLSCALSLSIKLPRADPKTPAAQPPPTFSELAFWSSRASCVALVSQICYDPRIVNCYAFIANYYELVPDLFRIGFLVLEGVLGSLGLGREGVVRRLPPAAPRRCHLRS